MNDLLKRLEVLRQSLSLGDSELITLQLARLEATDTASGDETLAKLLQHLRAEAYSQALKLLDGYLQQHQQLTVYSDPEIAALRLELRQLELRWQQLSEDKTTIEDQFDKFEQEVQLQLGMIFEHIAQHKRKIAAWLRNRAYRLWQHLAEARKQTEEENQAKQEYQRYQRQEQQSKREEEDFHQDYKQAKTNSQKLTPAQEKELKKYYRKASLLCHPDKVADNQKAQATQLIQQLNEAKKKKDLKTVKEIYQRLKSGKAFDQDPQTQTHDKQSLKEQIHNLQKALTRLKGEIAALREAEDFEIATQNELWANYFEEMKTALEAEVARLENEYENLRAEETPTTTK